MARKKKTPQRHEISMEHNGETYRAHYYVESGAVTVEAMSKDLVPIQSTTLIGGSGAEMIARVLLREMIKAGRIKPSP